MYFALVFFLMWTWSVSFFCPRLKAQWWGLWFTQAGSCAASWTPPIPSTRYSNVRQREEPPPPKQAKQTWSLIYHAVECFPVLLRLGGLFANVKLLDWNHCIGYISDTYVLQEVYPEVRFDFPLPYFRANFQDLFSSWELAHINFILFLRNRCFFFYLQTSRNLFCTLNAERLPSLLWPTLAPVLFTPLFRSLISSWFFSAKNAGSAFDF